MIGIRAFIRAAACALLYAAAPARAQDDDAFGIASTAPRSYALVIGVSDYDGDGRREPQTDRDGPFKDLPNACGDAMAVGDRLAAMAGSAATMPSRTSLKSL